jgi:hypothetical protein
VSRERPMLVTCPRCRAEIQPVPIVYGYPTPEAFAEADAGHIRLGGCMIGDESPEFECPACGGALPFASKPRRGRRGRTVTRVEVDPWT